MSIAVAAKTTRLYLFGDKGLDTLNTIRAAARCNTAKRRLGVQLRRKLLQFRDGYGISAVSLYIRTATLTRNENVLIAGLLADGRPFTGTYSLKTGAGSIDVTNAEPRT